MQLSLSQRVTRKLINYAFPETARQMPRAAGRNQKMPQTRRLQKISMSMDKFNSWKKGSFVHTTSPDVLQDPSKFMRFFFSTAKRYIPICSGSVWAWKTICSTPQKTSFIGGTNEEREKAKIIISNLQKRIFPFEFAKGAGIEELMDMFFQQIFSDGKFAAEIILNPEKTGIEKLRFLDPFKVYFKKVPSGYTAYYEITPTEAIQLNPATFFFYGLNASFDNPYGYAPMEATPTLVEIAEEMLFDMRFSSRNAGLPRLHFKFKQPAMMDSETPEDYQSRANDYFNNTVNELAEIGPDDNFYTWDDIEIGVAGGQGTGSFVWRSNRQQVDEEIITAFHLYPWVLGRMSTEPKANISAQAELLMQEADAIQMTAKSFIQWLFNTELYLNGIYDLSAVHSFDRPRDPNAKEIAVAESFKIKNESTKVRLGFIGPDDAARNLGLTKAYDPDRIYAQQKLKEGPNKDREEIDPRKQSEGVEPINKEKEV